MNTLDIDTALYKLQQLLFEEAETGSHIRTFGSSFLKN